MSLVRVIVTRLRRVQDLAQLQKGKPTEQSVGLKTSPTLGNGSVRSPRSRAARTLRLVRGNMERTSNHHLDSSRDVPLRKWTRSAAVSARLNAWPVTSSASDTSTTRFMSMHACGTVSGWCGPTTTKKNEEKVSQILFLSWIPFHFK